VNILMLYPKYPAQTFWNLDTVSRKIYGRRATMAPLGLLTVASHLPGDFKIRLVDRNVREESEADWEWADVVFLSLMLIQRKDYETCLAAAARHGKPVAVGGGYTSAFREKAAAEADWVCYGEAELVMEEFVADLRAGRRNRQYLGGNSTDLKTVRIPRYDLLEFVNDYYVMPVQFSRGCPFQCEFCDIIEIYGRVPRVKGTLQVLAELDAILELGFTGCIFIVDDNFIGNKKAARAMLESLAEWNRLRGMPYFFFTEASLNLADDPRLLDAMARANMMFAFIGIETPDPVILKRAGKGQNVLADTVQRLRAIRAHGVHVIAGMITGFDGEDRDVFENQIAFLEETGIGIVMMGLLQAIPNTRLWKRLARENRLLSNVDLSMNLTLEGLNFVPKGIMTKREYLESFGRMLVRLFEPESFFRRIVPAHLALRRQVRPRPRWDYFLILLRLCWFLGYVTKKTRLPFWRALFAVLRRNPSAISPFCYDCMHFLHLFHHAGYVRESLERYLAQPHPDDVLDVVVPFSSPHSAPVRQAEPPLGEAVPALSANDS